MKIKTIALCVVLTVSLAGLLQAKTLKFPKDNPQFSVTFTGDWRTWTAQLGLTQRIYAFLKEFANEGLGVGYGGCVPLRPQLSSLG